MKPTRVDIATVADEVLTAVEREDSIKQAEVRALREAVPKHHSDISQLMHKVAEALRADSADVTYEDLRAFQEGRL